MALVVEDGAGVEGIPRQAVEELRQAVLEMTAEQAVHLVFRKEFPELDPPAPTPPEEYARRWKEKWGWLLS